MNSSIEVSRNHVLSLSPIPCDVDTVNRLLNGYVGLVGVKGMAHRLLFACERRTKVTYGMEWNAISACVDVPLNVACFHASR